MLGIFGAAIFFGDGIITPAISVLSRVEGLEVAAPALHPYVVPITLIVLTCCSPCSGMAPRGVGKVFGPVMLVWFVVLAVLGLAHIVGQPARAAGAHPHHAVRFMLGHRSSRSSRSARWCSCVTGAEALYADMGHFGKRPIRSPGSRS